ncbi:SPFH domain-containing protein [Microseira wollei]|uniref:HflC/HflK family protein n=1 Tax=Microseira wollei NIES-4236 TaxID=2530354 RepID=A0AAV3XDT0_9CYAN|nr:stomatin-like protein [Microseira wollei]GET39606.1 HflC/HflK family protein [Microseira wollei NIES-4236]
MDGIIAAFILLILGSTVGSAKVINQGYEAIVEQTGKYKRTLKPGLNFIVPFLDTIVWEETTREQLIDIEPQEAFTSDSVQVKVDAIIYWKVTDLYKAYYEVEDLENALKNLVLTAMRSQIGQMELQKTFSNRREISQGLTEEIKEVTKAWGVEITRVEIQEIKLAPNIVASIEKEKAAQIERNAAKLQAQGVADYMRQISDVLKDNPKGQEALKFFLAQKFVDANYKLGESPNSKIVFMNPKDMSEAVSELMVADEISDQIRDLGGEATKAS